LVRRTNSRHSASSGDAASLHCSAVASERVKLMVQNRSILGSSESRRLRKQGLIPGVLYGREEPISISIPERDLRTALTTKGGLNAVLDVVVDGGKVHSSVLKEYQRDAIRGHITHIDLQEVRLDQAISATVPLHLHGEAAGVKLGGILAQVTSEVNVEALPMEVPEHLEADISELEIGGTMRLSDLAAPEGVTFLDDPETVIASITQPRTDDEPQSVEGSEGEAPTGEAAADEAAAAGDADAGSGDDGEPGTVAG
jgi:large subunit ribosomal protein L25